MYREKVLGQWDLGHIKSCGPRPKRAQLTAQCNTWPHHSPNWQHASADGPTVPTCEIFKTQLGFCEWVVIDLGHALGQPYICCPLVPHSSIPLPPASSTHSKYTYLYLYTYIIYISLYIYALESSPPSLSLAICFPLKQPDRVREYICRERGREERGKSPNSSISRSKCVGSVRFSREVRFYCSSRSRALRFLFCG